LPAIILGGTVPAMATPRNVWQVPRNDIAAATAFYERRGYVTSSEMHTLLMLQDDSSELRAVAATWDVRDENRDAIAENDAKLDG
jgi:hypothetical protein